MAARRLPPAAEALERDGEVLEAERFPQEANLEVVGVHAHVGRHVLDVGDADNRVVGHRVSPLACRRAGSCGVSLLVGGVTSHEDAGRLPQSGLVSA